jgi:uncharacterized protein YdaU (DUF1376 family)
MPFYPAHYLGDTQHLETVQHGAYVLLIMHYWIHDGLPDDDKQLAKITGLPLNSWRQMRPVIQAFFHDGWHHKRIDNDIVSATRVIEGRKASGSKGGTKSAIKRWGLDTGQANAYRLRKQMLQQTGKQNVSKRVSKTVSKIQGPLQLKEEDITTTFSGAARAREKNPTISDTEQNQRSKSVENPPDETASFSTNTEAAATKKSGLATREFGAGTSPELLHLVAAKGWVS